MITPYKDLSLCISMFYRLQDGNISYPMTENIEEALMLFLQLIQNYQQLLQSTGSNARNVQYPCTINILTTISDIYIREGTIYFKNGLNEVVGRAERIVDIRELTTSQYLIKMCDSILEQVNNRGQDHSRDRSTKDRVITISVTPDKEQDVSEVTESLDRLVGKSNDIESMLKDQTETLDARQTELNDKLFELRSLESKKRKKADKLENNLSVYNADKGVFSKINEEVQKELMSVNDIPDLFAANYTVFEFMKEKKLLKMNLTDIEKIKKEYAIFRYFYDLIGDGGASDSDDCSMADLQTDTDVDIVEFTPEFLEKISSLNILKREDIHAELNRKMDERAIFTDK